MTQTDDILPLVPAPDEVTAFFWDAAKRHELQIQRCNSCGRFQHLPAPVCRHCQSFDLDGAAVSGQARVYTWGIVRHGFIPYFDSIAPFCLAVVELPEQEGLRMVTNIVDTPFESIRAGMPVEVTFRPLPAGIELPVFRATAATEEASR